MICLEGMALGVTVEVDDLFIRFLD